MLGGRQQLLRASQQMHLVIKEQGKTMGTHFELAGVMGDILQLDIQRQDVVLTVGGAELLAHRDPGWCKTDRAASS